MLTFKVVTTTAVSVVLRRPFAAPETQEDLSRPPFLMSIPLLSTDPAEMEGIQHRKLTVNGIDMHVAEKGTGPVVVLIHGFPELWYSWRHQICALAARGFRAVAPDLRGYGDTSAPPSPSDYTIIHLVGDVVGLIDALNQEKVSRTVIIINLSKSWAQNQICLGICRWARLGSDRCVESLPLQAG